MEVAGVVIGAVPIVVAALKAWKEVHRKLRTFRHYAKEVKQVYDRVRVQKCVFENELEALLVASGQASDTAQAMLSTLDHQAWTDTSTYTKLAAHLRKDYEIYLESMQTVSANLSEIQREFKAFDCLEAQRASNERLKETIRRLGSAVKITFNKASYAQQIEALRSDNEDLRRIASYHAKVAKRQVSAELKSSRKVPQDLTRIRKATEALYEALGSSWSCANTTHTRHTAKLCLRARVEGSVRLDLALACNKKLADTSAASNDPPLWLYVRSLTESASATPPPEQRLTNSLAWARATDQPSRKKAKLMAQSVTTSTGVDLKQCSSFCDTLSRCRCLTDSEECLGYVESPNVSSVRLKHLFYHRCVRNISTTQTATELSIMALLEQRHASNEVVSIEDRLQLAQALASCVLHFSATPWLLPEWRLRDLSVFQLSDQGFSETLDTAHVTANLNGKAGFDRSSGPPQLLTPSSSMYSQGSSDEQTLYGVRNLMLFSLGIALLEIGQLQSLERFRRDPNHNNIFTARRLAERPTLLGKRYQQVVQRCLDCDFGCGNELDQEDLQGAVYSDVVCQLSEMLEAVKV